MGEYDINVLIVDDDRSSLEQSKAKVGLYVPADRIFLAADSVEIMGVIKSIPVDLAFLDLEMADTDGFSVAEYIRENQPGARYVFLTGHVELGAKSYDYEALDFLCKPLDVMRLQKTFDRFARAGRGQLRREEKIAIDSAEGLVMIRPDEVRYITRENRRAVLYCGEERHVARSGLDELELIFDDFGWFRCHQSYLIPVDKVRQVRQAEFGRTFCAVLDTGDKIPVSRGRYGALREAMTERTGKRTMRTLPDDRICRNCTE